MAEEPKKVDPKLAEDIAKGKDLKHAETKESPFAAIQKAQKQVGKQKDKLKHVAEPLTAPKPAETVRHSPIGGVEPVAKRNFSEFVRVPGVPS
jgi:hypothetical protein